MYHTEYCDINGISYDIHFATCYPQTK